MTDHNNPTSYTEDTMTEEIRQARLAITGIAQPGDPRMIALIEAVGPVTALAVATGAIDPADIPEIRDTYHALVSGPNVGVRTMANLRGAIHEWTMAMVATDSHTLLGPRAPDYSKSKPTVVCICGSSRFRDEIAEANRHLTLTGKIVVDPGVFPRSGDWWAVNEEQRAALDRLQMRKIDFADEVYVVNPGGRIGPSTRDEINYAAATGKPITYLEGNGQ